MGIATSAWSTRESNPQRVAILDAADRLLAGTPQRSTGNLSVVQLAAEADLKYWIVVQKHPDLRDHFQRLVVAIRSTVTPSDNVDLEAKTTNSASISLGSRPSSSATPRSTTNSPERTRPFASNTAPLTSLFSGREPDREASHVTTPAVP
jgi:hypothetical protein